MKKLKQLLWFVIPAAVCFVLYFLPSALSFDTLSKPSFVGVVNYFRMFSDDKTFTKALFNTFAAPVLIGFATAVLALILKMIFKKYKHFNIFAYSSLFVLNTAFMYFKFTSFFGYPSSNYVVDTLLNPEKAVTFDFNTFIFALEIGIFACFLFWLGCLIIEKSKRHKQIIKIAEENFNKTLENFAKQNPDEVSENFDMNDFSLHYHRANRNKNVVSYIFTVKYKNRKKYSYILKTHKNYEVFDDIFYKINPNT